MLLLGRTITNKYVAMRKCPKCGNEVTEDAKFCPNCGCSIPSDKKEDKEDNGTFIICPKCGKKVPSNTNFCPNCGHKFKSRVSSL